MLDWVFQTWGCVTDPVGCVLGAASAVPGDWWFYIGLIIGMTLGAIFNWWAIILFVLSFAIRLLPSKKSKVEEQHDLPFPDGLPPVRKVKRRKRPVLGDFLNFRKRR